MPPDRTRVFISYSHDSREHMDRVLELSNRLCKEGVDCRIDQYQQSPALGWPRWCAAEVREAEFVLAVCSKTYKRRFDANEEADEGKGVPFEGFIAIQEIYEAQSKNEKFVPIFFRAADSANIPDVLKATTRYDLSEPAEYENLYRRLTKQPYITQPPLGNLQPMPPRELSASKDEVAVAPMPLSKLEPLKDSVARPSNILPVPSPYFTGRKEILKGIQKKLTRSKCVALSGMRGVGKTQIAKQYVQSHRKDYSWIFWARAEKHETLVTDFASIAQLLGLAQKDEKDQSIIVAAVKNWLEVNSGWLFVLDNADDIPLAQQFVPVEHEGRVLLTSTASAFGGWAEKIAVEQMDRDEAALLLLRRAAVIDKDSQLKGAKEQDRKVALALGKELGWLPLAIDQAGAYITEMESTLSRYVELYKSRGKHLRDLRGDFGKDHPSVSVTFSLSFQQLVNRDPLAADLVRVCAFLAPDAIPEEILVRGGSALGEEFSRSAADPVALDKILKNAATFSLLRRNAQDRSIDIHRVVQEVLKDEMDPEQLRQWAERAARVVNLAFPDVEFSNWPDCERFLPHAKACAALIQKFSLEFAGAAHLLNQTAFYMNERAQYAEAEPLYKRSLAIREKALGLEDPDVAISLNNLAGLYDDQGRYAEAEPLYLRSLGIREKASGPEHPDVATSLNNLALLYKRLERYAEAEPLYRRSLAIREKALDREHPDVANSLNNLASFYRAQGRLAEAEPLHKRALTIREKASGPEHPDVANSLNNLAALYWAQGRYVEAEPLYKRSLAIREKALGPDHPNVATSLNNLASLYGAQGRHAEAEPLYKRAIAIDEKALGSDHPALAPDLNNLALLYDNQGRYAEAEHLYKRSLAIREKALGPDHPKVATALGNYALLLRKTGRGTEALPLEARANTIREKMKNQVKP